MLWKVLTRYVDDGTLEIDDNAPNARGNVVAVEEAKSTENHDEHVPDLPGK